MPRARRPAPVQVVGSLPSSRLPVGTPTFPDEELTDTSLRRRLRGVSPTSARFPSQKHALNGSEDSDSGNLTHKVYKPNIKRAKVVQPSHEAPDTDIDAGPPRPQTMSELRLHRQNLRIEVADPTLPLPNMAEKWKPSSRNRGKAWKPFNFGTETSSARQSQAEDGPVAESRVNIFRAQSQASSNSRPVSRVSSHNPESTASEAEGRDSSFLESDDFQLFTGRKKHRAIAPAYEEKSNPQHATVEATFSKREITDVFGNELPGPGFMDANPGNANGQLQFIQHPNGDVSAHQWSTSRYGWENIGQFSNIRKKIEGQLAACRLKGETAGQALQQNTMAYFRAIAKQREADVMGFPFGVKEIAACLPDKRPPSTAPTGPRRITSKVEMPERPSTMKPRQEPQMPHAATPNAPKAAAVPPKQAFNSFPQVQNQQPQPSQRFNPALNFIPAPRERQQEDPFVGAPYYGNYGGVNYNIPQMPQMPHIQPYYPVWPQQMNYYQAPSHGMQIPGYVGGRDFAPTTFTSPPDQNTLADQVARLRIQQDYAQQGYQNLSQGHSARLAERPVSRGLAQPVTVISEIASPTEAIAPFAQSKPPSPLETRTAMREHVIKMGEQAKERTKSQANIRTVLYDPFQDQSAKETIAHKPVAPEPVKHEVVPTPDASGHTPTNFGFPLFGSNAVPGLGGFNLTGESPFPTTLAPSVTLPSNSSYTDQDNDLRQSSPDRDWQHSRADKHDNSFNTTNNTRLQQWDSKELDEWLWSSKKFARQESFHRKIMARNDITSPKRPAQASAQQPAKPTTSTHHPIAPSSSHSKLQPVNSPTPQSNILTNRLLVPVLENLASYTQGPVEKRRDYFCQWTKAPEWAIDRGPNGNDSFFDSEWGTPPARLGRDPRYQPLPRGVEMRFGAMEAVGTPHRGVAMPFGRVGRY